MAATLLSDRTVRNWENGADLNPGNLARIEAAIEKIEKKSKPAQVA